MSIAVRRLEDWVCFWARAVRPFAYTASIMPVVAGTLVAWRETGAFSSSVFLAALAGGVLLHTGANLANDYFDFLKGVDRPDTFGGSGLLSHGLAEPRRIRRGIYVSFALALLLSLYLIWRAGPWVIAFGLAGMAGGYAYTGRPLQYKYHALGDLGVFVLFGPLMVLGAYFVQTRAPAWGPLIVSVPIGCLTVAILHANNHRDLENDRRSGIRTLAGLVGAAASRRFYYALLAVAFASPVVWVSAGLARWPVLLPLLAGPLAAAPLRKMRKNVGDLALQDVDVATAKLHLVHGVLMQVGIALAWGRVSP